MRAGSKLWVAVIAVLLAIGLAACGGGDDSGSTAANEAGAGGQSDRAEGKSGDGSSPGKTTADREADGSGAESGGGQSSDSGGSGSDNFVPKQHDDSGGGSEQFRVKGGDNSVQEFGAEADDSELDAAATALHNFLDARAAEDWESACSFLSKEVRQSLEMFAAKANQAAAKQTGAEQIEDTSCAGILGKLTNRAALPELRKEAEQADVGSLRIEGDRAFVIYRGLGGTIIAIPMKDEGGSWKVASLAGTPLN